MHEKNSIKIYDHFLTIFCKTHFFVCFKNIDECSVINVVASKIKKKIIGK